MKLHNYFRSSASFRVRIALELKGLAYDYVSVHLVKGEHKQDKFAALTPTPLVPALQMDDGEVLGQSMAIIEYLDETHPQPPLLPARPLERARVRALAQLVACEIHPLNNLRVLNYLKNDLKASTEQHDAWYRHWIRQGFTALEAMLKAGGTGRFSHGDAPTLADVMLVPQMANARRFNTDLTPFPTLVGISTHLESLPAFAAARPEVQPDAQ